MRKRSHAKLAITVILASIAPVAVWAETDSLPESCERTPAMRTSNYPGYASIMPHNQLAKPAGKAVAADGRQVYLYARLFDRDCVPVQDAKVELWSADTSGRYRFATKAALANEAPVFSGAGRATTDNEGRFDFFTLYPAKYRYTLKREDETSYTVRRAPHINVAITHPQLKSFRTTLFFEGDSENPSDHYLKRLSSDAKARVSMKLRPIAQGDENSVAATIDIILPDRDSFRKY